MAMMAMRQTAKTAITFPWGLRLCSSTTNIIGGSEAGLRIPIPPIAEESKRPKNDPSTNLFISGLNKRTTSDGLNTFASQFGQVVSARVVTDRATGYSKGFGFVNYASLEDADKGIQGMDAKFLDGWVIFAEYARPRDAPPQNNPGQFHSGRY